MRLFYSDFFSVVSR